jgi:hypothetical protein
MLRRTGGEKSLPDLVRDGELARPRTAPQDGPRARDRHLVPDLNQGGAGPVVQAEEDDPRQEGPEVVGVPEPPPTFPEAGQDADPSRLDHVRRVEPVPDSPGHAAADRPAERRFERTEDAVGREDFVGP